MVDIHCHILPGVDDGCKNLDESLKLAESEDQGRTRVMIATPHVNTVREIEASEEHLPRVDALNKAIRERGIKLKVVPGAELYPTLAIIGALKRGLPITLAGTGKYVLLDTPRASLPFDFGNLLFELQSTGVTPILAHPERNFSFQQDPNTLLAILERGPVCQVNVGSLRGKYGPAANDAARLILRRQWAHFLATDAHAPKDYGILERGVGELPEELSDAYRDVLVNRSGQAILDGDPLPELERLIEDAPQKNKKKGGWVSSLLSRRG